MIYRGRNLDVISLWGDFCDLEREEPLPTFLAKVQCPNPEHDTFKRHFQINTQQPRVHCFAECGISGSYEHAICVILGIYHKRKITNEEIALARRTREPNESAAIVAARTKVMPAWKEARKYILKHTSTDLGKVDFTAYSVGKRKTVTADDAVAKDEAALKGGTFQFLPKEVRAYLDEREINAASRGKWQIGWDEDAERLVIPAYDERGTFRFLIRRKLDNSGSLKYLYTEGAIRSSILFGANMMDLRDVRRRGMILDEGSIDTIHLHQIGFPIAGGVLGSGISKRQIRIIDRIGPPRLYLMFDADAAGIEYVLACADKIKKYPLFVCRYPSNRSDPAEMNAKEVERSLTRALPMHEFLRMARNVKIAV